MLYEFVEGENESLSCLHIADVLKASAKNFNIRIRSPRRNYSSAHAILERKRCSKFCTDAHKKPKQRSHQIHTYKIIFKYFYCNIGIGVV